MYYEPQNIIQEVKAKQTRLQAQAAQERLLKECADRSEIVEIEQVTEIPARFEKKQSRRPRLILCPWSAR